MDGYMSETVQDRR